MPRAIDIYKAVLTGKRKRFPRHFWEGAAEQEIKEIVIYLIDDLSNLNQQEIVNIGANFFIKHKLGYLLNNFFNNSPFAIIDFVYPDKFNPWEFSQTPRGYWTAENCNKALDWLMQKYDWDEKSFAKELTVEILDKNNLGGMFEVYFKNSIFNVIDFKFPGKFKALDFNKAPKNYRNKTSCQRITLIRGLSGRRIIRGLFCRNF